MCKNVTENTPCQKKMVIGSVCHGLRRAAQLRDLELSRKECGSACEDALRRCSFDQTEPAKKRGGPSMPQRLTEHVTSKGNNGPLIGKFFWCSVLRENRNEIKFQNFWIWLVDSLLNIGTFSDSVYLDVPLGCFSTNSQVRRGSKNTAIGRERAMIFRDVTFKMAEVHQPKHAQREPLGLEQIPAHCLQLDSFLEDSEAEADRGFAVPPSGRGCRAPVP